MKKVCFWLFIAILASISVPSFAASASDCRIAEDLADADIIRDYRDCEDYDLDRSVQRQEVAGIALAVADECRTIRDVESISSYRCRNIFADVTSFQPNRYACHIAETLAENDIITTSKFDRFGRRVFRPTRSITKAEALAMMMDAADIRFRNTSYSRSSAAYGYDAVAWQKPLIETAYDLDFVDSRSRFYPNRIARRSDIFSFALDAIDECDGGSSDRRSYGDIELRINDVSVDEDDDYAEIPVVLSERAEDDVIVRWRTDEDTARDGSDYRDDRGTLRIRAGDTRDEIRIRLEDDNRDEDTERFYVEITDVDYDGDEDIDVEDDRGTVHIRDDDGGARNGDAEISIEDETVDEDDDEVRVEVCLDEDVDGDVEVEWETEDDSAREGSDYRGDDGRITIDEGDRCEFIEIEIEDDNRDESTERFFVEIVDVDNDGRDDIDIDDDRATITIRDDDGGSGNSGDIEIEIDDVTADEDDDEIRFTVELSDEADGDIEIEYRTRENSAQDDQDYEGESGTLVIREGDTRRDIVIDLIDDNRSESTETFYVDLIDADNDGGDDVEIRDDRGVGTIRDDDGGNSFFDADVEIEIEDEEADEDDDEIRFTVRLSERADDDIWLEWRTFENSAEDDEDYEGDSGRIRIDEGDLTETIEIELIDDNRDEGTERFFVEIFDLDFDGDDDVEIVDDRATGTIRDDD